MRGKGLVKEERCGKEKTACEGGIMRGGEIFNKEYCGKEKTPCKFGNLHGGELVHVNEERFGKEKTT